MLSDCAKISTTNSCLDFFHQSPNATIRNSKMQSEIVHLLKYFTQLLITSLEKFYLHQMYHEFDPHVGENSCQIRTYLFLSMAKNNKKNVKTRIYKLISIYKIIDTISKNNFKNNSITIKDFIQKNNLYYKIYSEEIILMKSYFLSKFKNKFNTNETYIDTDLICKELSISRKLSKRIIHSFQISLSKISCNLIFSLVDIAETEELKTLYALKKFDDDSREVLPCYFLTKILAKRLIDNLFPVILICHRKSKSQEDISYFSCDSLSNYNHFSLINFLNMKSLKSPFFIIEGETIYENECLEKERIFLKKINKLGLYNLLMFNMAAHIQYPGNLLKEYDHNMFKDFAENNFIKILNSEFSFMRNEAHKKGCSKFNKQLFFIKHIYIDNIFHILSKSGRISNYPSKDTTILEMESK